MDNIYQTATIVKIEKETDKLSNFTLDKGIEAKPGQYLMVWLPRINEKPFGIALDNPLTLSIARVGPFTEIIHKLRKGDKLTFRGPYGTYFEPKGKKLLLIGGGYGVVPLYFLATSIPKKARKNISIIIGAKTKRELPFVAKFKNLGCKVSLSTDDGSAGVEGFSTDLAQKLLSKNKYSSVYTCGPQIMMEKIASICKKQKIFCQVSLEKLFKCGGMGLCGECSFKGKLVCKDGPVFSGYILL